MLTFLWYFVLFNIIYKCIFHTIIHFIYRLFFFCCHAKSQITAKMLHTWVFHSRGRHWTRISYTNLRYGSYLLSRFIFASKQQKMVGLKSLVKTRTPFWNCFFYNIQITAVFASLFTRFFLLLPGVSRLLCQKIDNLLR